jgi:hypothetical protein
MRASEAHLHTQPRDASARRLVRQVKLDNAGRVEQLQIGWARIGASGPERQDRRIDWIMSNWTAQRSE